MANAEYFTELKVEASQILWEIFLDRATLCSNGRESKLLKSHGTINMRATYREDDILTALLQGWQFVKDQGLEYCFIPYDYYYCEFFLNNCLKDFTSLKYGWMDAIKHECNLLHRKKMG